MKKNIFLQHRILFLGLLFFIIIWLNPWNKYSLYNASTYEIFYNPQIKIDIPFWGYLVEPFTGLSRHFTQFYDFKKQLLSWIIWLLLVILILSLRKKPILILRNIFLTVFGFLIFILYTIFVPLPSYYLKTTNPDYLIVDPHSHTHHSWDAIPSLKENIIWHQNKGFDVVFITEHDKVTNLSEQQNNCLVIPGIEINRQGSHYLVLGTTDCEKIKNKEDVSQIVSLTRDQGGIVIVSEWWHDKAAKIETIVNYGVDGFEIINGGFPNISVNDPKEIFTACKKYGLTIWTGTNWHGWSNFNKYWNIVHIPGWRNLSYDAKTRLFMNILCQRNTDTVVPIVYQQNQQKNFIRIIFEPWFDIYYYLSGLNWLQTLSWMLWSCMIYLFYKSDKYFFLKRIMLYSIGLLLGIFFIYKSIIYYQFGTILVENKVLLKISYTLFVAGLSLIILPVWNLIRFLKSNIYR